jgi:hypothetical protein
VGSGKPRTPIESLRQPRLGIETVRRGKRTCGLGHVLIGIPLGNLKGRFGSDERNLNDPVYP